MAATTLSTETATEIYTQCSADPPPLTPPIICLLLFWSNWNIAKVLLPEANSPIFTLSSIGQSAMTVTIERWRVVRKDILGGASLKFWKVFFLNFCWKANICKGMWIDINHLSLIYTRLILVLKHRLNPWMSSLLCNCRVNEKMQKGFWVIFFSSM